jgi:hypothetical protein
MLSGITGMGSAKITHFGEELLAPVREAGRLSAVSVRPRVDLDQTHVE